MSCLPNRELWQCYLKSKYDSFQVLQPLLHIQNKKLLYKKLFNGTLHFDAVRFRSLIPFNEQSKINNDVSNQLIIYPNENHHRLDGNAVWSEKKEIKRTGRVESRKSSRGSRVTEVRVRWKWRNWVAVWLHRIIVVVFGVKPLWLEFQS